MFSRENHGFLINLIIAHYSKLSVSRFLHELMCHLCEISFYFKFSLFFSSFFHILAQASLWYNNNKQSVFVTQTLPFSEKWRTLSTSLHKKTGALLMINQHQARLARKRSEIPPLPFKDMNYLNILPGRVI